MAAFLHKKVQKTLTADQRRLWLEKVVGEKKGVQEIATFQQAEKII